MAKLSDAELLAMYRCNDDCLLDFARALIEHCASVCDKEQESATSRADNETAALRCAEAIRRLNG